MKKLILLLLFLISSAVLAQDVPEYILQVIAESAYVRSAPITDAQAVASVFANDSLLAVGRNIDGGWLEVRRPGQQYEIGWIARQLVAFTFDAAQLPITDLTTGVIGQEPVVDTGFAALTINETPLRSSPDRRALPLLTIPVHLTLPVLERTPDLQWLKVNYRGTLGWIPMFLTNGSDALARVAVSPEFGDDPRYSAFVSVPPEQQLAQIERLLGFLTPIQQTTAEVAHYWQLMSRGETLECLPPAGNYPYYEYTPDDILQLPELRQQDRLLRQAIDDINASIEAMRRCGVYLPRDLRAAYADAINAQAIFRLIASRMEILRERVIDEL